MVAFATLFNGYQIKKPDGTLVDVPIKWASKQKWYTQLIENASKDELVAMTLPRMGFIITDISYDFARKTSSLTKISAVDPDDENKMRRTYMPVPYRIGFDLYIGTRTIDEGLQLIEQIVPFFTPSFNITINELDIIGVERDIPIKLETASPDYQTDTDFDGQDIKLWTLGFSMEVNLYKDITSNGIIKHIVIDIKPTLDKDAISTVSRYKADVDPDTAIITDEYEVLESIEYVQSDTSKL